VAAAPPVQPKPAKVVVKHAADQSQAGSLQASPDSGLVSEELLQRAIKANVELAEALAGVVRHMNRGLGEILSHAELVKVYKEDDKKLAAVENIFREANRLRGVIQQLGAAGDPAAAASTSQPPPRPTPSGRMPRVSDLSMALRDAISLVKGTLDARGVSIHLQVTSGTQLPRLPQESLRRAVGALLEGVSATAISGSSATLRCEKKPVVLRGRNGEQMRREFLMLALKHGGTLSAEDQQRVLQGGDQGPLGEAWRLTREMGGFVRFAPLAAGGQEARLFLPAT